MSKAKARTIQQRLGFMDNDLKSSKHDEIMLWLDNAVENHFNPLITFQKEWKYKEFYVMDKGEELRDSQREIFFKTLDLPEKPNLEVVRQIWEYPITTGRDSYIVGFADMRVDYYDSSLTYYANEDRFQIYNKEKKSIFFEAKSEIHSLGELIRQIRMYQTYTTGEWFVVSPDSKFDAALEKQNIYFLKYETERFCPDEAIGPDGTKYKIPIR